MDENQVISENIEEVADLQLEPEEVISENTEEVAEPLITEGQSGQEVNPIPQSPEENARFAQQRREREFATSLADDQYLGMINPYTQTVIRSRKDQEEFERAQAMSRMEASGISQEDLTKYLHQMPEYSQMKSETEFLREQVIQRRMKEDLDLIKTMDSSVSSLDELGEDFLKLIGAGIDAKTAFMVLQQKKQEAQKDIPPDIGAINNKSEQEREYFTSAEVDKLTDEELDNPEIMAKVMKSMGTWK